MGGKSSTTTSQVTVPPEVIARYNAVNARAEQVAQTPFQQYSTDPNAFVAPINAQQNQAISNINTAANQAQPYFTQATGTLNQAQAAAQPYYGAAGSDITGAQSVGSGLAGASLGSLLGGGAAAAPLQNAANQNYGQAYANAQPYQIGSTGLALAGAQAVNPGQLDIQRYLSPYLQDVLGSEAAVLNQNNQQQQAGQLGNAIRSGAFGGDRAGIAAANLEQQQNLANAQIYSGILNQGFNTALGAAQQQQGVGLGAAQANRAALQQAAGQLQGIGQQGFEQGLGLGQAQQGLGAQVFGQGATTAQQEAALGQQQFGQGLGAAQAQASLGQDVYGTGAATSAALANLGTGAQGAALQGAQAQLGAGTLQQQTTQAGDTALYNQFLQQQSYPFQVAQFLANIAEGTGALSGSTTTTNQPGSLFSDERLKEDIEPIGKTYDGQNIVAFRYKGDPTKRIGLIAQDVEKKHPEAVGEAQGYKTVDYDKATEDSARRGHFALGGSSSAGSGLAPQQHLGGGWFDWARPMFAALGHNNSGQTPQTSNMGLNPISAMPANGNAPQIPQGSVNPPIGLGIVSPAFDPLLRGGFKRGGLAGANDNRQGYAFGGYPTIPGMSAGELQALIAQQQQMYAPFSQAGLYGGGLGAVRGGSSYVPQANLPVSSLAVSQVQPRSQESALATTKELTDLASNKAVNEGYNKLISLFRNNPGSLDTAFAKDPSYMTPPIHGDDVADSLLGDLTSLDRKRGGRAGYDDGGSVDPYGDDSNTYGPHLHIPSDTQVRQLATAANPHPQQQQSGLSELGGLASGLGSAAKGIGTLGSLFAPSMAGLGATAAGGAAAGLGASAAGASAAAGATGLEALAPFLLAFLKRGGRVGYAGGGATEPDFAEESLQKLLLGLVKGDDQTEAPPGATDTDTNAQPQFAAPAGGLGGASSTTIAPKAAPTGLAVAVPALATAQGLPNTLDKIMPLIAKIEGNASAPTKYSTAQGEYGITNPTFVGLFKEMYPDQARGLTNAQILARRSPQIQAEMGPFLAKQNIQKFLKAGIEPSAPNIYLSMFLGPAGAQRLLRNSPDTPLTEAVDPAAIAANPWVFNKNKTVGDLQNWSATRLAQAQAQLARQGRARGGLADGGDPEDAPNVLNTAFSGPLDPQAIASDKGPNLPPPPTPQGLAAAQRPIDDGAAFPPVQMGAGDPSQHQGAHGFIDRLKQPEIFIPLLTGLAAAAAAPTRNPLTALAVGAGSAGQAYQAQRAFEQQQQQLSQHGAEVNVLQQALGFKMGPEYQLQLRQNAAQMIPVIQAQLAQQYQLLPGDFGPDNLPQYKDVRTGQKITATQYGQIYNQRLADIAGLADSSGTGFGKALTGDSDVGVHRPLAAPDSGQLPPPGQPPAANVQPAAGAPGAVAGNPQSHNVGAHPVPPHPAVGLGAKAPQAQAGNEAPGQAPGHPVMPGDVQMLADVNSGRFRLKNTLTPPQPPDETGLNPNDPNTPAYQRNVIASSTDPAAVAAAQDRLAKMLHGDIPVSGPNGVDPRFSNYQAALQAYNAQVGTAGQKRDQFSTQMSAVPNAYATQRQILDSFSQALQANSAGAIAENLSEAAKRLYPLMPPGKQRDQMYKFATNIDVADKDAARLAIAQAIASGMSSGSGGATLLDFSHAANPHVGQTAGAQWQLLTQAYAMQDRALHEAQDFNNQKSLGVEDVDAWNTAWQQRHPYQQFQAQAENYTPFFADMSDADKRAHPRTVPMGVDPRSLPSVRSGDYFRDPRDGKLRRVP